MAERRRERPGRYRPARDAPDDDDAPAADEDAWQEPDAGEEYPGEEYPGEEEPGEEEPENDGGPAGAPVAAARPDVFLDVPALKVEEIHLEVDDLSAQVSLQANVLDLLKLHVGAEVSLARVLLDIKGVDAAARLTVRLDKVASIIHRVMETIDDNPQILTDLTRGLGEAATGIGDGAAGALGEVGRGAGRAVGEVGEGTGRAVGEVGEGAGSAVESVGGDLQEAADDLGERAGRAAGGVTADGGGSTDEGRPVRRSAGSRRQEREGHRGPARRPPPRSGERPRQVRHDADGRLPAGPADGPQAETTRQPGHRVHRQGHGQAAPLR